MDGVDQLMDSGLFHFFHFFFSDAKLRFALATTVIAHRHHHIAFPLLFDGWTFLD